QALVKIFPFGNILLEGAPVSGQYYRTGIKNEVYSRKNRGIGQEDAQELGRDAKGFSPDVRHGYAFYQRSGAGQAYLPNRKNLDRPAYAGHQDRPYAAYPGKRALS